jgi:hypothetical protein
LCAAGSVRKGAVAPKGILPARTTQACGP